MTSVKKLWKSSLPMTPSLSASMMAKISCEGSPSKPLPLWSSRNKSITFRALRWISLLRLTSFCLITRRPFSRRLMILFRRCSRKSNFVLRLLFLDRTCLQRVILTSSSTSLTGQSIWVTTSKLSRAARALPSKLCSSSCISDTAIVSILVSFSDWLSASLTAALASSAFSFSAESSIKSKALAFSSRMIWLFFSFWTSLW
mmetsp:Transcript_6092/g.14497  ORF Transcript_6092/g.14497 Transcript_6092/m.14497 type:complete len:201 (-) Transcript_6092:1025-1627(-)